MKKWESPVIFSCSASELKTIIKARAMSVGSAMSLGALYDQGCMNYNGLITLPQEGYEVQARVIGYIALAGYFVYEVTIGNIKRIFRRSPSGSWYET